MENSNLHSISLMFSLKLETLEIYLPLRKQYSISEPFHHFRNIYNFLYTDFPRHIFEINVANQSKNVEIRTNMRMNTGCNDGVGVNVGICFSYVICIHSKGWEENICYFYPQCGCTFYYQSLLPENIAS